MSTARVVAARYTLIRPIGRGSLAMVYVAKDRVSDSLCAVKLIPARSGLRPDEVAQLSRTMTRMLDHPGVTPFEEVGLDGDGRTLYFAMQLLHGVSLRELIHDPQDVDVDRRIDLLERILDPLAAAHSRGLVHGNLTPSNVFEVRSRHGVERATLLDVGLAETLFRGQYSAVATHAASPHFQAPEALGGGRLSPAADVWSFGVMLYEAVTGRRPFAGLSNDSIVRSIAYQPHRPIDQLIPDVDRSVARLVDLCLDKSAGQRPHDARALMRLFKTLRSDFASDPGIIANHTVLDRAGAAPSPPPDDLDSALRRSPRDPSTHRALLGWYRAEGIEDGAWLAASALDFLGDASRDELHQAHHHRRPIDVPVDRGLDAGGWATLLHPDQDPRVDAVWREIAPAIAQMHRRSDDEVGLNAAKKVDVGRASDELSQAFRVTVGALRPSVIPRLYRAKAGTTPKHVPTGPAASVFGRGFEEPLPAGALRFAVGRHIAYYRNAHRVCVLLSEPEALEVMFSAATRLGLGWPGENPEQQQMIDVLRKQMRPQRLAMLQTACQRLGTSVSRVDLGSWRRAVELSCCRAGLALGASLEGTSWMLRWTRERRHLPTEDAMDDLLRFWSSGNHVRVRHLLGISVSSSA